MAHGFLTPTPVSGDNFWRNVEWLWKKLNKEKEEKEEKEKGGALATTPKPDIYDPSVKAVRVTEVGQKQEPKAATMLKGSPVAKMIGAGSSNIVSQGRPALPPAAPSKGGTFTNIPGVSAAPKKLDSEAFFKAAQTGVDPQTGRYLSSEERKDYLKKSKSQMNATASVASAGASGISSASLVTKGDEAVVGSVENLTKVVTSLVDAVKAQTTAQKQISDKEAAKADTLANRALAREEEKALEGAADNSGFITPSGGIQLGGNAAQGGMGGGAGGGPGLGLGGKVAANAIAKRGVGRMATRYGAKVAGKQGAKMGSKVAGKLGLKALGIVGKKIPLLGLGLGGLFAAGRAMRGDWAGAGMELASGAASTVPGFGTAASLGIDAALMAKDAASGMARGGLVTGGKKSVVDDVPIRADEGEVVMSNSAGNAWGRGTLLAMNAMGGGANKPTGGKGYAEGGLVGGDKAKSKQMFKLFGEGMIDAQKANSRDFARIQSQGLKQYYENEGGGDQLGKSLVRIFSKVGGVLGSLFSGTLTSLLGGAAQAAPTGNPADYLNTANGGQDLMTLATIAALESGSSQGQADVAQSVYNRLADKTYGKSITEILTKQGQYQVAFKDPTASSGAGTQVADEFKNIRTEDDAVKAMMYYYNKRGQKITAEQARQKLRGSVAAIQDAELQKKAAQHVGGRTEFLSAGSNVPGAAFRGGGSDNKFFAAYGSGNQMSRGATAAPTGLFDGSTSAVLSTGRLPALPDTGTMHGQAYGANRRGGRKHAGVDFDIKGNEKFYSRIGGTVVKVGYDPSGYGNYVDIYNEQLKVTERIAEGAKVLVQQGQKVSPGAAIVQGETNTGVIHYEIRKEQGGFGFSGTVNPLNFLASATSKNPDVATARPAAGGGGGGRRGSGSSPGSLQAAPANQNNGTSLAQASGQVSMMAMGMNTPTGNIINNIYGGAGGQQGTPTSNSLSAGATAASTLFNWKAARR
jgi:hypothetical protein